jgi:iron complex outermembrane recepter protein
VDAGDRAREVRLDPMPVQLQGVEVRSRAFGRGEALQAAASIGAEQLAERMAPSIAAVIAAEPGVTARTNGPMATQPVIRGLGGDRVLVLEDGLRTGDIATTAPDHAVTVEPATARRIEVIRGPAGLLYGSNTLGGVVNVVREDVPREIPSAPRWQLSSFGESVNRGVGGAGRVQGRSVRW